MRINDNTIFWSNSDYVKDWLSNCPYRFSIKTLGKGHRGVILYILENPESIKEFIQEYNKSESSYALFCLTANQYTSDNPIYVSISKFGYNYGGKFTRKPKNKK